VTRTLIRPVGVIAALVAFAAPLAADRWKLQYFYDKNNSTLVIADIQFPSATRGVAVGVLEEGRHQQPTAVVTADGGAHWQIVPLKETPVSLFFLNEGLGWLVTTKGLWKTNEAGKSWTKMAKPPSDIVRVYFTSEQDGWAACLNKTVLETRDGGQKWTKVAAAAEQPGAPRYSAFNWIAFATPQYGAIVGVNLPPRRDTSEYPDWYDPDAALRRRETPHLELMLATKDGGKTWKSSSASVFGRVTRIRFTPQGKGLGLIEYGESFQYPSETYRIDWTTGISQTVYKDSHFAVTDIWLHPDGTAYLSGIAVAGELRGVVPGKVRVLSSRDLTTWADIDVDYRAVARRTMFAGAPGTDLMWMATDNGMILKLDH
jgi:hypothetical protein